MLTISTPPLLQFAPLCAFASLRDNQSVSLLLGKMGFPPDGQEEATTLVPKQAEALADLWSEL